MKTKSINIRTGIAVLSWEAQEKHDKFYVVANFLLKGLVSFHLQILTLQLVHVFIP